MKSYRSWLPFGLFGAAAGVVNGLFGAGGGMVLVPLLIRGGKLPDQTAYASSIAIILPLCLVSLIVYSRSGSVPWGASLPYLAGGLLGGLVGGLVFRRIPPQLLHRVFGAVIVWGGLRLLL